MSEVKVDKISPATGTDIVTLGDSGDNFKIPSGGTLTIESGGTITNSGTASGLGGGKIVQVVHLQDGAVASGTTTIPDDDTIPQNTEGDEWNTLAITPTSATNKLLINVVLHGQGSSSDTTNFCALFQDTTAGALAATQLRTDSNARQNFCFTHYMTAGTTSSTTFKVRIGGQAGTMTINGHSSTARVLGGVLSSTITITEIEV